MSTIVRTHHDETGFSVVEFMVAAVIFGILVIGVTNSYTSLLKSYRIARQLNEIYTVLTACPEIDRALEYSLVSDTLNCYPNNSFAVEDNGGGKISYTPVLNVADTASLPASDPLKSIPSSKAVDISVKFPWDKHVPPLELRLLITQYGVGQQ